MLTVPRSSATATHVLVMRCPNLRRIAQQDIWSYVHDHLRNAPEGEFAGFAPSNCALCGPTVLGVIQRTKKFTLYFIPVLTYGRDSKAICAQCGSECYLPDGSRLYSTEYAALTALAAQQVSVPRPEPAAVSAQATGRAQRPCRGSGRSNTTGAADGLCWSCYNARQRGWAD